MNVRRSSIAALSLAAGLACLVAASAAPAWGQASSKACTCPSAFARRVVEYALEDPDRPQSEETRYRLVTTILDPGAAPAAELARNVETAIRTALP